MLKAGIILETDWRIQGAGPGREWSRQIVVADAILVEEQTCIHRAYELSNQEHSSNDFPCQPIQTRICKVQHQNWWQSKQNCDEYV